jgi:hypothetical protein
MYDYVQFDSFSQAKAAMSLSKVRFLCNQCGKIHYFSCLPNTPEQINNRWSKIRPCARTLEINYPKLEPLDFPDIVLCLALKPEKLKNVKLIQKPMKDAYGTFYEYRATD